MKACNQCGKCCTKYGGSGLSVSAEEVQTWETFNPEVRDYVRKGEIWFHPSTGTQLEHCPWLVKLPDQPIFQCEIYLDRPNDCRYYPTTVTEMVRDECEMIEAIDITNLHKAQQKLDTLMTDSRPPVHKSSYDRSN